MNFTKHLASIYILAVIIFSMTGCSLFEPASPSASYIQVDSIQLYTDYSTQGSNSASISDAWVILDNGYLGTFPLPSKIPIIGEGLKHIVIRAGIIENGIAGTRSAYPKYASLDTTVSLKSGQTVKIEPRISYGTAVTFAQLEDFDDASLSLSSTSTSFAPLMITTTGDPEAFEGNSGEAILDSAHTVFEVASAAAFPLASVTTSYVELNYKCENDFSIGVIINYTNGGVEQTTLLSLHATTIWKKVYVSLNNLGGIVSGASNYKIFLRSDKNPAVATSKLYFDNLKVLY